MRGLSILLAAAALLVSAVPALSAHSGGTRADLRIEQARARALLVAAGHTVPSPVSATVIRRGSQCWTSDGYYEACARFNVYTERRWNEYALSRVVAGWRITYTRAGTQVVRIARVLCETRRMVYHELMHQASTLRVIRHDGPGSYHETNYVRWLNTDPELYRYDHARLDRVAWGLSERDRKAGRCRGRATEQPRVDDPVDVGPDLVALEAEQKQAEKGILLIAETSSTLGVSQP